VDTYECVTQHEFYTYYLKADVGVYHIRVVANGTSSEIYIEAGDEPIWVAFTYWNDGETSSIGIHKQTTPILIV